MKQIIVILTGVLAVAVGNVRAEDKVDFVKQIQPIFEQSCVKCHGPEKQKGGLRMDSKDAAMKGGKDAVAIVVGDASKSDLYRRIILPLGNDDVMPAKGDLLTKAQTDLIRDWINQGAVWPETAVAKAAPEQPSAEAAPKLIDIKPTAAEVKAVAKLDSMGIAIRPVAMNLNWHEASFRAQRSNSVDSALAQLKDVLSLTDLNLAGTKFSDAAFANLKGLTNLARLHLEHTQVKDAQLEDLRDLSQLVYLNLFDTPVTDAGLEHLKGLNHLVNLHLWQTKVTPAGIAELQKALPNCKIDHGWEMPPMAKKEDEKKK